MLRLAERVGVGRALGKDEAEPGVIGFRWLNQVVILHKMMCFPVILTLAWWHSQLDSVGPMLYLALHGCYGICWVIKAMAFPDSGFHLEVGVLWALFSFACAALHWVTSYIIVTVSYADKSPPEAWRVLAAVSMYVIGFFSLYTADCQKHFTLKYQRPRTLITEGMFARCRNTNYLGEILIYSSFALLSRHSLPWITIALFTIALFLPNMIVKDASLARFAGFAEYERQSHMLLPRLFPSPSASVNLSRNTSACGAKKSSAAAYQKSINGSAD
mmetsp:Transcript_6436/g.13730  ORF Transcript_6436/g.13730 Transcript_6436/m.13730 type:complete len:273 (-) Transcript_6436:199-1017(-)